MDRSHSETTTRRGFLKTTTASAAISVGGLMMPQLLFADDDEPIAIVNAPERKENMASVKGTNTEKNLMKAFAGESQARNRYTYFAGQARKEGFEQISAIFEETANQEKEHAKRFFSFLEGGALEITAAFPAGVVGSTAENLKAAASGEHEEWSSLYPEFAKIATSEGFPAVAKLFENVSVAEKMHEQRYLGLLKNVEEGTVFERDGEVFWQCRNCGYTVKGNMAPPACPACAHPKAFFQIFVPSW